MNHRHAVRSRLSAALLIGWVAVLMLGGVMAEQPVSAQPATPEWIQKSNQNSQVLLEVMARFSPESAAQLGVPGLDEEIFDLQPQIYERSMAASKEAVEKLRGMLATETDPNVKQDLEILIDAAEQQIEGSELNHKYMLPYFNLSRTVFMGLKLLLDEQNPQERHAAALVRLKRYAGTEEGYTPIAQLAQDRIRERLEVDGLLGPSRDEVDKDLTTGPQMLAGLKPLFEEYGIDGYEEALSALNEQLAAYDDFVRSEILPRARDDFRQPEELYAHNLKQFGVDFEVPELMSRSEVKFREIQNEMEALSILIARERGFDDSDYRQVIRTLKKDQIVGEDILPHYRERIAALEQIIRDEKLVSLPDREMRMRLASEAESAALPAPHMQPPRLIGNTGESGTFVLPLRIPAAEGEEALGFDDFTFAAASWTLTAHEGRPGHEMQFAAMVEKGVSIPRAIFSFNSVNVEGWALYTEAEVKPYLPLEGQLIALQHRLLRAARAFLDPGLQLGEISREEAHRILTEQVVVSEAMAQQEVERYTFRMPGQATSYFVGYERLMELRAETERILGDDFDRMQFHDFVLSQGLLPPKLLRQAVLEQFVPTQKRAS